MGRLKPETYESVHYILRRMYPMAKAGKLGPFLIQLPPNFRRNDERLEGFLAALPQDFAAVAELEAEPGIRPRYSVEFRHESWSCAEVEELLRRYRVAFVASDRDEARADRRATTDFHYIRLRREDTDEALLDDWAQYVRGELDAGRDCYLYCKHEDDGSPWIWADYLKERLGLQVVRS